MFGTGGVRVFFVMFGAGEGTVPVSSGGGVRVFYVMFVFACDHIDRVTTLRKSEVTFKFYGTGQRCGYFGR